MSVPSANVEYIRNPWNNQQIIGVSFQAEYFCFFFLLEFCELDILLKYCELEVEKLPAKLIRQEVCNKEMWKR